MKDGVSMGWESHPAATGLARCPAQATVGSGAPSGQNSSSAGRLPASLGPSRCDLPALTFAWTSWLTDSCWGAAVQTVWSFVSACRADALEPQCWWTSALHLAPPGRVGRLSALHTCGWKGRDKQPFLLQGPPSPPGVCLRGVAGLWLHEGHGWGCDARTSRSLRTVGKSRWGLFVCLIVVEYT